MSTLCLMLVLSLITVMCVGWTRLSLWDTKQDHIRELANAKYQAARNNAAVAAVGEYWPEPVEHPSEQHDRQGSNGAESDLGLRTASRESVSVVDEACAVSALLTDTIEFLKAHDEPPTVPLLNIQVATINRVVSALASIEVVLAIASS